MATALSKKALGMGSYYLLEINQVLELYQQSGYNVDDEEEEVPNVLTVEGEELFFTGDLVKKGQNYYEIVIAANGFSWEDVESDMDEDEE
jgi:hypothetical protein